MRIPIIQNDNQTLCVAESPKHGLYFLISTLSMDINLLTNGICMDLELTQEHLIILQRL